MADHRLQPSTPLGHATPAAVTIGPVTISEVTDTAYASLAVRRGRRADFDAAAAGLGLSLPQPGKISAGGAWSAVWMGPEQWLVMAPLDEHDDIAGDLIGVFADAASITEQTDAFARFDLTGREIVRVLERLCPLDIRAMQAGEGARSVVEHISCLVLCRAPDHIALLVPRSYAGSLHHALVAAARSVFGLTATL